jgi:hypothetical protein
MPFWLARRAAPHLWRRVPWKLVWAGTLWLLEKGRERVETNLDARERKEFQQIVLNSKGRPGKLSNRDKTRLRTLAGKALRGD